MRLSRSHSRTLAISALLVVVLFKFQNCASVSNLSLSANSTDPGQRIVDQWQGTKVSFLNSDEIVPLETSQLDVKGLCVGSLNGEVIHWELVAVGDTPVLVDQGEVTCSYGNFELSLEQLKFETCTKQYYLRAIHMGQESNFAELIIQPECGG